jgi:16S rRNA processing protein RimM
MGNGSSSRSSTERHLRIGAVGRPHGNEGACVVVQPTARLELLAAGGTVAVAGREREIEVRKGTRERPIVKFEGVNSRDAAEQLRGQPITIPRSALGALGAGEFLIDDLIGCEAFDGARRIGRVVDVLPMPSTDVLEIEREGADVLLVPLVGDAVRSIDVEAAHLDIDAAFVNAD